jgi:DnaJ like chaperone protein
LADDCGHQELVRILKESGACEPTIEIDGNVLDLVIHMFRNVSDTGQHISAALGSNISNARKSVKLNTALLFLSASMLAKLAHVDGQANQAELACFSRFITCSGWNESLKLAEEIFYAPINTFSNPQATVASFRKEAGAFAVLFRDHGTTMKIVTDELFSMASADGPINQREIELLDHFLERTDRTGCRERYYYSDGQRHPRHDRDGVASDYLMLECNETDSDIEIRTQFRKLVKEYHPDAIQGKDLPKDFIEFASRRLAEIQESYKRVMDHRRKQSLKCVQ